MNSLNLTSKKFYSQKPSNKNIIKRALSFIDPKNNTFYKSIYNNNKENYNDRFLSPKLSKKYEKLPLLNSQKYNQFLNKNKKIANYEKMKNYRIKLKKVKKVDSSEDQLFKLLHQYGLHYSFSSNKYIIGDKFGYYSKYLPDKFKVSFSSDNIINPLDNNIKNISDKDIPAENQKTNINKKLNKKSSLFYSTTEEDDEDKMSFKKYMKLQSMAEIKFRPKLGETSYDLVNYIKKIDGIRKGVVNNLVNQINNVENRYNIEKPKEDSRFNTKMQGLYHHKWKNIFSLREYQELFSENLKGKISSKNYEIMNKNFRDIFLMCFSSGNINLSKIKAFQE